MTLPISRTTQPMEALSVPELPTGEEWQYEPKWDGFRCLAFRDAARVDLQSKAGKPLGRYFPEMDDALLELDAPRFVLDGELVVPEGPALSFDQLLQRIHPAASRVRMLSEHSPALYIVFDLLVDAEGADLTGMPLLARREALEAFATLYFPPGGRMLLSPATTDLPTVEQWARSIGSGLDGLIAKRRDLPYRSGERDGMRKVKSMRSADCVVGGFRYASRGGGIGSLLLGLFDEDGLLHHLGFTSSFTNSQRTELLPLVEPLRGGRGFSGNAPGGPSRWSTERSAQWEPLDPSLVVEVQYDHFTNGRFRHGTRFLRWRPDKAPRQCTMEQVAREERSALVLIGGRK
jgi:ATP-dependent DNA ligase